MTKGSNEDDDVAQQRDEVIKRMHATPPKPHAAVKRRQTPSPEVRQLPKHRTNKKRKDKV